jgi:hypothetical protein
MGFDLVSILGVLGVLGASIIALLFLAPWRPGG